VQRSAIIAVLSLIPAISVLFLGSCKSANPRAAMGPPPAVPVTIATAETQSAPIEVRVVGSVEPSSKVEIKSQVAGQLAKVHFTEGQNVKQGDLLLEIDSEPYREALRQTEAAIERDRAQLRQAEFALQKDIVQSKSADADAERYAALAKERVASQQQELQYRTTAETLKQAIRADQAAIESARASLKVDEAAVSRAQLDLSYCQIHAPISGRAGNLLVHPGNLVKVNDVALVVINHIEPVFVSFNAPENHLATIRRLSANRKLPVEVIPRETPGAKARGYLSVVDNTVDTQTATIHLKATVDNADRLLWPGEFVDVVLTLDAGQNATVIPSEAVQAGQQGQLVYVVKPDKTVEPRMVSVGRNIQNKVIVEKGVKAGETVVTDGQMLLYPGAHILVTAAPKGDIGVQ
jgi:membrane fusion protein, multidrug efflux system